MMLTLTLRDPSHLEAHRDDFAVPLELALDWARGQLERLPRRSGIEHLDFEAPRTVGRTGLRRVWPWTRSDFWAARRGRTTASHLIVGHKTPTRRLCVWGEWAGDATFVVFTLYPGRKAPREIHDPELPFNELKPSLAFWTRHAIVVGPGDWEG